MRVAESERAAECSSARNILSVLRQSGVVKRAEAEGTNEEILIVSVYYVILNMLHIVINILLILTTIATTYYIIPWCTTYEEMLFMRTVRDMNLSKLVADDVPLFLALLKDIIS